MRLGNLGSRVVWLCDPTHEYVKLPPVAPGALEEHMAKWGMRSLALYILQVQEFRNIRSLFYIHPSVVLFVFLFFLLSLSCRFFVVSVIIILFGAYSPSFRA